MTVLGVCQVASQEGEWMSQQSVRQAARRAALEVQSVRRRQRAEREKRLEAMAVRVLVAVRERDAAVADAERRAGAALREMTASEGLTVREAAQWCGEQISSREATRLQRLGHTTKNAQAAGIAPSLSTDDTNPATQHA